MNSISEILCDKLYLSGVLPYLNDTGIDILKKIGITLVINVAYELDDIKGPWRNIHIKLDDSVNEDISKYFDYISSIILNEIENEGGKVLIHCYAGVSRSSSFVIAYLVKKYGYKLDEAYDIVSSMRNIIRPNPGFIEQLEKYSSIKNKYNSILLENIHRVSKITLFS